MLGENEIQKKSTPACAYAVLGIEWLLCVTIIVGLAINLCLSIIWKGVAANAVSETVQTYEPEDYVMPIVIFISGVVINVFLIIILGKGIIQRDPTKCKIWITITCILLFILMVAFGFTLVQRYFDSMYHMIVILYLVYKVFAICSIVNFIKLIKHECVVDEVRLFPSIYL